MGIFNVTAVVIGVFVAILGAALSAYSAWDSGQKRDAAEVAKSEAENARKDARAALAEAKLAQGNVQALLEDANRNLVEQHLSAVQRARYGLGVCARPPEVGGPKNPFEACRSNFSDLQSWTRATAKVVIARFSSLGSDSAKSKAIRDACSAVDGGAALWAGILRRTRGAPIWPREQMIEEYLKFLTPVQLPGKETEDANVVKTFSYKYCDKLTKNPK